MRDKSASCPTSQKMWLIFFTKVEWIISHSFDWCLSIQSLMKFYWISFKGIDVAQWRLVQLDSFNQKLTKIGSRAKNKTNETKPEIQKRKKLTTKIIGFSNWEIPVKKTIFG